MYKVFFYAHKKKNNPFAHHVRRYRTKKTVYLFYTGEFKLDLKANGGKRPQK